MRIIYLILLILIPQIVFSQDKKITFKVVLLDEKGKPVSNEKIFIQPKYTPNPGEPFISKTIYTTDKNGSCLIEHWSYFNEFFFGSVNGDNSNKRIIYRADKEFKKKEPILITLRFN